MASSTDEPVQRRELAANNSDESLNERVRAGRIVNAFEFMVNQRDGITVVPNNCARKKHFSRMTL